MAIHVVEKSLGLRKTLKVHEKRYIKDTLTMYDWDMYHTAEVLGIGFSTLYRKVKEYGIKNRGGAHFSMPHWLIISISFLAKDVNPLKNAPFGVST